MKFGIAFDLKPDEPLPLGVPDDVHEEFDAPSTIRAIRTVLENLGHDVIELGDGRPFLEDVLKHKPDFIFNFAEGTGTGRSREARIPAVCELLGIPYTGSDPLTMAVALEKDMTRRLAMDAGVLVPPGLTLSPPREAYDGDYAEFPALLIESGLQLPVIAKPVYEGSSKGIRKRCLIETPEDFGKVVASLWADYGQTVLVEEFIQGVEVTVGLVGNDPPDVLGVMSIRPKSPVEHFVYSLEVKRDFLKLIDYEVPAKLSADVMQEVVSASLAIWEALGCRDVARLDFRIRGDEVYFLEINPLPGLNPESSDLVILANLLGMTFEELVTKIVKAALARHGL